jgi:hypothetical protein
MSSLAAAGDYAESANAFRRSGQLLSVVLGLKPSVVTEQQHLEIAVPR